MTRQIAENAETSEKKADSWKVFVRSQLKNGAAASHRLVKRDSAQTCDTPTVTTNGVRSASPQAIVEHDLAEWREIWLRLHGNASAP